CIHSGSGRAMSAPGTLVTSTSGCLAARVLRPPHRMRNPPHRLPLLDSRKLPLLSYHAIVRAVHHTAYSTGNRMPTVVPCSVPSRSTCSLRVRISSRPLPLVPGSAGGVFHEPESAI